MIKKHDLFNSPDNQNQKIWRYLDFTKLVDLLYSSSLYFTRADLFNDIFEGSITKTTSELRAKRLNDLIKMGQSRYVGKSDWWSKENQNARKEIAINCWHMNDHESAAMWKLYLKSNEGIAIQSTYERLIRSLDETKIAILVGAVKYIDYDKDMIDSNKFSAFLHKRKSFEHEKELRCIIWKSGFNNSTKINLDNGGVKVEVNLMKLIENVYVSPDSPTWFTELVKEVSEEFEVNVPVINSRINDTPIY